MDTISAVTLQNASACARFLSIPELVNRFLYQADVAVHVNCQRVCRQWQTIDRQARTLQENLFLIPRHPIDAESADAVELNSITHTHFGPLSGDREKLQMSYGNFALQARPCQYADLGTLPCARDGTHADTRARGAFARTDASWRKMLISQPPTWQLDWWHAWESCDRRDETRPSYPIMSGRGHESDYSRDIVLGALWDLMEARLVRGCSVQATFFTTGGLAEADPSALEDEILWESSHQAMKRGLVADARRVRVRSQQVWPGEGPSMYQTSNVHSRAWDIQDSLPFTPETDNERRRYDIYDGNDLLWLRLDSKHDNEAENWRWSSSDAFASDTLHIEKASLTRAVDSKSHPPLSSSNLYLFMYLYIFQACNRDNWLTQ